jgi:hypothetical protein
MRIAGAIRAPVPVLCMPRAYPLARVAVTARYLAVCGGAAFLPTFTVGYWLTLIVVKRPLPSPIGGHTLTLSTALGPRYPP